MHILVFETRVEGHHLSWLRYVVEDFLSVGHRVTLCLPWIQPFQALYQEHLVSLLDQVDVISALDGTQCYKGGTKLTALGRCLVESKADQAFVNNLDDMASNMFRWAAFGIFPPRELKGRLSGIYFRPRFLDNPVWPPGNIIKMIGFKSLVQKKWFRHICLLDEFLYQKHCQNFPEAGLTFLPDTWSGDFSMERHTARKRLCLGTDKFVILHYGIGTRRKGLHLVIRALHGKNVPRHWHLLCAGKIDEDKEILEGLRSLAQKGSATVLNRYVSKEEEQVAFAAADAVVLPYVRHFGSSGVLAIAAAARKMVIVSDEGLIANRVRQKQLGICFSSGSTDSLRRAINEVEVMLLSDSNTITSAAEKFASSCDRKSFRAVITSLYSNSTN